MVNCLSENIVISGSSALYFYLKERNYLPLNSIYQSQDVDIFYIKPEGSYDTLTEDNCDEVFKKFKTFLNDYKSLNHISSLCHDDNKIKTKSNNYYYDLDILISEKYIINNVVVNLIKINNKNKTYKNAIDFVNKSFDLDLCKAIFDGKSLFHLNNIIFKNYPLNNKIVINKISLGNKEILKMNKEKVYSETCTLKLVNCLSDKVVDKRLLEIFKEEKDIFKHLLLRENETTNLFWNINTMMNGLKRRRFLKYYNKGFDFVIDETTKININLC